MAYTLEIRSGAKRLFKKLPKDAQKKIIEEAEELKTQPMLGKPLRGKYRKLRSLRFNHKGSSYRIAYQVFPDASTILIRLTGTRQNFYKHLDRVLS